MKQYLFIVCIFLMSPLTGAPLPTGLDEIHLEEDDISKLDVLIQIHQENLEKEKVIKTFLTEYKALEKACTKSSKIEDLTRLTHIAYKLHTVIQEAFLEDYFRPQFMQELKKLAMVGEKKRIPSVK